MVMFDDIDESEFIESIRNSKECEFGRVLTIEQLADSLGFKYKQNPWAEILFKWNPLQKIIITEKILGLWGYNPQDMDNFKGFLKLNNIKYDVKPNRCIELSGFDFFVVATIHVQTSISFETRQVFLSFQKLHYCYSKYRDVLKVIANEKMQIAYRLNFGPSFMSNEISSLAVDSNASSRADVPSSSQLDVRTLSKSQSTRYCSSSNSNLMQSDASSRSRLPSLSDPNTQQDHVLPLLPKTSEKNVSSTQVSTSARSYSKKNVKKLKPLSKNKCDSDSIRPGHKHYKKKGIKPLAARLRRYVDWRKISRTLYMVETSGESYAVITPRQDVVKRTLKKHPFAKITKPFPYKITPLENKIIETFFKGDEATGVVFKTVRNEVHLGPVMTPAEFNAIIHKLHLKKNDDATELKKTVADRYEQYCKNKEKTALSQNE